MCWALKKLTVFLLYRYEYRIHRVQWFFIWLPKRMRSFENEMKKIHSFIYWSQILFERLSWNRHESEHNLKHFIYSFEIRQRALYSVLADCVEFFSLTAIIPNSHKYRFSHSFDADSLPMRLNSSDFSK